MIYRLVLIWLLLLQSVAIAASPPEWNIFLSNPTQVTYRSLMAKIDKCKEEVCKYDSKPDSHTVVRLIKLIK